MTSYISGSNSDNEERLGLIINATRVGIWDWQVQTGELTFNERWAEMIGYSVAELEPLTFDTWADNVHPDDLPHAQELLDKHWEAELESYELEYRASTILAGPASINLAG